jgi:hypothetical protein
MDPEADQSNGVEAEGWVPQEKIQDECCEKYGGGMDHG